MRNKSVTDAARIGAAVPAGLMNIVESKELVFVPCEEADGPCTKAMSLGIDHCGNLQRTDLS